jgi:hypothetical protein
MVCPARARRDSSNLARHVTDLINLRDFLGRLAGAAVVHSNF